MAARAVEHEVCSPGIALAVDDIAGWVDTEPPLVTKVVVGEGRRHGNKTARGG